MAPPRGRSTTRFHFILYLPGFFFVGYFIKSSSPRLFSILNLFLKFHFDGIFAGTYGKISFFIKYIFAGTYGGS